MKSLIAGWFSFRDGHATAGDLLTRDVVCDWLDQLGFSYDLALDPTFSGGVDWRRVNPADYACVLFVCGPFQQSGYEIEFLDRFSQCRLIGLNLSMTESTSTWNPFDLLLERDSSEYVRPDLVFLSSAPKVPVVGVCLVESYPGALVKKANEAIKRLVNIRQMAVVRIDTRLDSDADNSLRTPAEIETLIGVVDLLITTRLHGLVLALKNGIPAIAIDPEPGGAKIHRQAKLLGWPASFVVDSLKDQELQEAYLYCVSPASRAKARECGERAKIILQQTYENFLREMRSKGSMEARYQSRTAAAEIPCVPVEKGLSRSQSLSQRLSSGWKKMRRRLCIGQR